MAAESDDLSKLLPPELSDVVELSDEEFASFGDRLRESVKGGGPDARSGLHHVVAQALWGGEAAQQQRLPTVVRELIRLGEGTEPPAGEATLPAQPADSIVAIVQCLFRLALDQSLDAMRVRPASTAGAPCALVLGFAGSSAEELEPQAKYYASQGMSVISMTKCAFPLRLAQRQNARLAHELQAALSDGSRLLVHVCSMYGFAAFSNLIDMLLHGKPPFDSLPALAERLAAIVFECVPILPPAAKPEQALSVADLEAIVEREEEDANSSFIFVSSHVLQELCTRYAPELNWYGVAAKSPVMRRVLRMLPWYDQLSGDEGTWGGGFVPFTGDDARIWWGFEHQMLAQPLPRLLLYSAEDKLFPQEMVEASSDLMWEFNRKVKLTMHKCTKSPHMKLWELERKACEKAIGGLLKQAKIHKR